MNYKFGDVISMKFPQSGRQDTKRRPAVVVLDIGDADVVVVPVTSVPRSLAAKGVSLENYGVQPDVTVDNTPTDFLTGHDRQIERALEVLDMRAPPPYEESGEKAKG